MDCRQTQRMRYDTKQIHTGRTALKTLLEQGEGVASVTLKESELCRNSDNEFIDKYYVALSDPSVSTSLVKSVEQSIHVFESSIKGTHVELSICHASYLHAQDTLSARLSLSLRSVLEVCACGILVFILFTHFIL